jgi:ferritin-like metal-binding protein YciE
MNTEKLHELLYEAYETEKGGVQVYETALRCAVDKELKKEWEEYLDQTRNHVEIVSSLLDRFGLDASKETPGRAIVRHIGTALVEAMEQALSQGDREVAQKVAAECVTHAETKDHANWELIGLVAENLKGEEGKALKEAYEEVEEEEDEHLYHTKGWARELSVKGLGLPAVTPPPEEKKDVKTAIGAERAKNARNQMVSKGKQRKTG